MTTTLTLTLPLAPNLDLALTPTLSLTPLQHLLREHTAGEARRLERGAAALLAQAWCGVSRVARHGPLVPP